MTVRRQQGARDTGRSCCRDWKMTRTDLAIVGAGPAGMGPRRQRGVRSAVLVIDEQPSQAAQVALNRTYYVGEAGKSGRAGLCCRRERVSRFRACGTSYWPSAMVCILLCTRTGTRRFSSRGTVWPNRWHDPSCLRAALRTAGADSWPDIAGCDDYWRGQTVLKSSGLPQGTGSCRVRASITVACRAVPRCRIPVSAMLDTTPQVP